VGPRAGLDRRKISSQPDLIPDHPAHSQSLYQLHHTHTHTTAQFLMWHTITFLITAIIYLLLNPQLLLVLCFGSSCTLNPPTIKVCIHTASPECKKNCMSWQALCLSWHFLFIPFFLIFPMLHVFHLLQLIYVIYYSTLHSQKILPNWRGFSLISTLYMINFCT